MKKKAHGLRPVHVCASPWVMYIPASKYIRPYTFIWILHTVRCCEENSGMQRAGISAPLAAFSSVISLIGFKSLFFPSVRPQLVARELLQGRVPLPLCKMLQGHLSLWGQYWYLCDYKEKTLTCTRSSRIHSRHCQFF